MIRAEITGRLVADPSRRRTGRGIMASTSVAVAVGVMHRGRPVIEPVVLSADGRVATQLLQFQAGDAVTAVGRLNKVVWSVPGSEEQSFYWELRADQIVPARDRSPPPQQPGNAHAKRRPGRDSDPALRTDRIDGPWSEDRL